MTALSSYIEDALTFSVTDGTGEAIPDGLGNVAIVAKDVALGGGSEIFRLYSGQGAVTQAALDVVAGEIDAATYNEIVAAHSQGGYPAIYVVLWDDAGGDGVDDALTAAESGGLRAPWDFYFVTTTSRAAADHVELATWAATKRVKPIVQSGDADWLTTGGVPTGYTSITGTKLEVLYEDTAATCGSAAWAGRLAIVNPDLQRPASNLEIKGGILSEYTTPLTSAQKGFLGANNCNFHAVTTPKGTRRAVRSATSAAGMAAAQALDGTSSAINFTRHFIEIRGIQAMGELLTKLLAKAEALGPDAGGTAAIRSTLRPLFATLLQAGYITPNTDAGAPDGYTMSVAYSSGATPTATVSGNIYYRGEVVAFAFAFDLV